MKERINITIDPDLLERVDRAAAREHTTRSAFIRRAVRGLVDRGEPDRPGHVAESRAAYATAVPVHPPDVGPPPATSAPLLSLLRGFFAARDDIAAAWVFGSVATGRLGPMSDVDVAILPETDGDRTIDTLDVSSRLSDLLGGRRVDVVVLGEGSTLLSYRIACEGVLITEPSVRASEARLRALTEHLDLRHVVREADERFAALVATWGPGREDG